MQSSGAALSLVRLLRARPVVNPDCFFEDEMKALNQLGWMSMCDELYHVMMTCVILMVEPSQRLRFFDEQRLSRHNVAE